MLCILSFSSACFFLIFLADILFVIRRLNFRYSWGLTHFCSPSSVSTWIHSVRFFLPGPRFWGWSWLIERPSAASPSSLSPSELWLNWLRVWLASADWAVRVGVPVFILPFMIFQHCFWGWNVQQDSLIDWCSCVGPSINWSWTQCWGWHVHHNSIDIHLSSTMTIHCWKLAINKMLSNLAEH